jgi:hypothetical protein
MFFPEKRLRSLSIDSLSYALTMLSTHPSRDSQTIPSTLRCFEVRGNTLSVWAATVTPHMRACSVAYVHLLKPGKFMSDKYCAHPGLGNHYIRDILLSWECVYTPFARNHMSAAIRMRGMHHNTLSARRTATSVSRSSGAVLFWVHSREQPSW